MPRRLTLLTTLSAGLLALVLIACGGDGSSDDGTDAAPTASDGTPAGSTTPGGSGSGGATVTFVVDDGTAAVGQTATVDLEALDVGTPGMGAWTIDVAYDSSVVSATCEVDDAAGLQFCNPSFDDGDGLALRLASANASGTDPGDLLLMTMTFTCNTAGTSDLTISVDTLADATVGNPVDINHTEDHGSITCT